MIHLPWILSKLYREKLWLTGVVFPNPKGYMHPYVYNRQIWKQPMYLSANARIHNVVYPHNNVAKQRSEVLTPDTTVEEP